MTKNIPAISVVMPVYNEEKYIIESVQSILTQSFTDFEFIIVDDCSTDATYEILQKFKEKDSRIRIIRHEKNLGRPFARNTALFAASAPLMAILDADDYAYPTRLEKQYAYMQANPEVTVCGTWTEVYENNKTLDYPTENNLIKVQTIFNCCFINSSVMLRKDDVIKFVSGYDTTMSAAQDYDLWARLMIHPEVRFANIPEVLVKYRVHPQRNREKYSSTQLETSFHIRKYILKHLDVRHTEAQFAAHLAWCGVRSVPSFISFLRCLIWAYTLIKSTKRISLINHNTLKFFLKKQVRALFLDQYCSNRARNFLRKYLIKHLKALRIIR